jgi:hypothetical protein
MVHVLPYPGGRHPRIGFLDGAVDPLRGTKASVFLPWDPASYVVVDLPEAIFTNLGLTFLAHAHIPSKWDSHNLENRDWRHSRRGLLSRWPLPNGIVFGASIEPREREVAMELWLRNGTPEPLTGIRAQVCVMLKGAGSFNQQTKENKLLRQPIAAARDAAGERWLLTAWEPCGRVWENPPLPCIHADPVFPNCSPGQTVRARGRLWFSDGRDIDRELGAKPL